MSQKGDVPNAKATCSFERLHGQKGRIFHSAYDEVLAKHATPVSDASQDGPQNQIESKPADAVSPTRSHSMEPV